MGMIRKIIGRERIIDKADGGKIRWTNKEIRTRMNIGNIADELSHRRLRFLQRILSDEEQNVQVMAGFLGELEIMEGRRIGPSRWIQLIAKDIEKIAKQSNRTCEASKGIEEEEAKWLVKRENTEWITMQKK